MLFSPSNYYFSNLLLLCSLLIIITITHAWEPIDDHHSAEVMDIANHVLTQLPARVDYDEFLPFIEVTDEKVNRGDVFVKVWDAQQEVRMYNSFYIFICLYGGGVILLVSYGGVSRAVKNIIYFGNAISTASKHILFPSFNFHPKLGLQYTTGSSRYHIQINLIRPSSQTPPPNRIMFTFR